MDNGSSYFSESFHQARKRLLESAGNLQAEIVSYDHPLLGKDQEELSTDVIYLGPQEPEKVFIVISGVHGAEGFYGSALQLGLLDDPDLSFLKKEIGILLIHAINPYGFSHFSRETEGNVDLNRNFIDHEKSYPSNLLYDQFADEIISKKNSDFQTWIPMNEIMEKVHPRFNPKDLFSGQYTDPDGLFFGGHMATWSNKIFYQILDDFVANVPNIVFIDLHTGYGDKENLEIYSHFPENSLEHHRIQELFYFEKALPSPYKTTGTLLQAAIKTLAPSQVISVLVEKGSCTPSAIEALREDRWLSLFGDPSYSKGKEVKLRVKEALCPSDFSWREDAFQRGMRILKTGLYYLVKELILEKIEN